MCIAACTTNNASGSWSSSAFALFGTFPDSDYQHEQVQISSTDILFIFSDGVYELQSTDGEQWTLKDFEQVLLSIGSEQEKFSRAAKQKVEAFSASSQWDDDFSMLAVQFR